MYEIHLVFSLCITLACPPSNTFFLPTCAPPFMSLCVFGPLSLTRAAWESRGGGYLLELGQWTWLVHWRKWYPKWALASSSHVMSTNILVDKRASTLSSFFLFLYQNKASWCSCLAIRDLLLWEPYQCIINVTSSVANICHGLNYIISDKKSWRCFYCTATRSLVLRWVRHYLQVSNEDFMSDENICVYRSRG